MTDERIVPADQPDPPYEDATETDVESRPKAPDDVKIPADGHPEDPEAETPAGVEP